MKIEIIIMCHNYQRRLCWDLSSLAQQVLPEDVKLCVSVASFLRNGEPTTEDTLNYFKNSAIGMNIKAAWYNRGWLGDRERFAHRGYIRNDQVAMLDKDTDWVLFSDCDMVYDPTFFAELAEKLKTLENVDGVVCVGRLSNDATKATNLVNSLTYPLIVDESAALMAMISDREMGNVAAGYFQLVPVKMLNGYYIEEGKSNDKHMFNKHFNPKSDLQFKKRFDNRKIKLSLKSRQYHINHTRDPEAGKHLEEQR